MDGVDAHPARQVQHVGEKFARQAKGFRIRGHIQRAQIRRQFILRPYHPFAEAAVQPDRHLRRRGLGVGEAEDFFR